jgi:KUP system potassium uptake protein
LLSCRHESRPARPRPGIDIYPAGLFGTTLFYADSILTPAISVLSALEGVAIASPALAGNIMPIAIVILVLLFSVQRFGTRLIGRIFGPLIFLWFLMLGITGVQQIVKQPRILQALNPARGVEFLNAQSAQGGMLSVMGNIVLGVTGSECLYADMGHFGTLPVRLTWFLIAFPALTLNYLGQGALLMGDAGAVSNPFYSLFSVRYLIPAVAMSTVATVIASQAVISGAYSVSCEAMKMGLLPRMEVVHTSKSKGGQIYVPTVNLLRENLRLGKKLHANL